MSDEYSCSICEDKFSLGSVIIENKFRYDHRGIFKSQTTPFSICSECMIRELNLDFSKVKLEKCLFCQQPVLSELIGYQIKSIKNKLLSQTLAQVCYECGDKNFGLK